MMRMVRSVRSLARGVVLVVLWAAAVQAAADAAAGSAGGVDADSMAVSSLRARERRQARWITTAAPPLSARLYK